MKTNVLVVGAGFAGCTLGLLLIQAGQEVLLAELRDAHHKTKLCAGAMHHDFAASFDDIYGTKAFAKLAPYASASVTCRCLDSEAHVSCQFEAVPRKRLDDYCLARYESEGGCLVDRVKLLSIDTTSHVATFKDLRQSNTFAVTYDTLVGADGVSSAVRHLLTGRKQRTCIALQADIDRVFTDPIFEYRPMFNGYCWYIPHDAGATIGCMGHGTTNAECRGFLSDFCVALGLKKPSLRGAPIPSGDDVLLQAGSDAWLVGDAAGLIKGRVGGGIGYALKSAHALSQALTGGEPYERAMSQTLKTIERNSSSLSAEYFRTCINVILEARKQASATPHE